MQVGAEPPITQVGYLNSTCLIGKLIPRNHLSLIKEATKNTFDLEKIKTRRTVRSNFLGNNLKKEDLDYLIDSESDFIHYLPATSQESQFVNE
jgi:hypothetical protein